MANDGHRERRKGRWGAGWRRPSWARGSPPPVRELPGKFLCIFLRVSSALILDELVRGGRLLVCRSPAEWPGGAGRRAPAPAPGSRSFPAVWS
jgi:hypothetical protein